MDLLQKSLKKNKVATLSSDPLKFIVNEINQFDLLKKIKSEKLSTLHSFVVFLKKDHNVDVVDLFSKTDAEFIKGLEQVVGDVQALTVDLSVICGVLISASLAASTCSSVALSRSQKLRKVVAKWLNCFVEDDNDDEGGDDVVDDDDDSGDEVVDVVRSDWGSSVGMSAIRDSKSRSRAFISLGKQIFDCLTETEDDPATVLKQHQQLE